MKIVHIESGLGNQMLSYAEYLLIKKLNPSDDCYIETIIYDIPECNDVICQWNGFELSEIFNINAPNIRELFSDEQWNKIVESIVNTEFWLQGWNYPTAIVNALNNVGYTFKNYRGTITYSTTKKWKTKISDNRFGYWLKRICRPMYAEKYTDKVSKRDKMFIKTHEDVFAGQFLGLCQKKSGIEFIEDEIRKTFEFPQIYDDLNLEAKKLIKSTNSVAIHARRGDMLGSNGFCYKYGYFKRAVKYIKNKVENPEFFFFCDPGSVEWCKHNEKIFGLDFKQDKVHFIDWNKGRESFRDMQLMAECKHNIITNSSFGWWGAYLNTNPNKITCSPCVWINTTHTF